ncbi:MAG: sigma-E factor negative regulatory protein RseC [Alphaproteobacteria bacterium]|jgi:sigma-E factor negative regulatory protein RseC
MIEEMGTVVAVEGNHVWVETQVKTTCAGCKASDACPTSTIAKAFTPKANHVLLEVPCVIGVGQQVKIGISEKALLWASLMVYVVPLLLLIISATIFEALFPNVHELIALFVASLAAFCGFWWASVFSKHPRNKHKFMPVFLGATISPVVTHKHEIPVYKIEQ